MNSTKLFIWFLAVSSACAHSVAHAQAPPVTPPPESFFEIVRRGRPGSGARVLQEIHRREGHAGGGGGGGGGRGARSALTTIVTHMLAGRPDIVEAMVKNRMYLIIIGKDQVYTDMPEYRNHPNPAYQNERVRGTGGQAHELRRGESAEPADRPLRRRKHRRARILPHDRRRRCGRIDPDLERAQQCRLSQRAIDKGLWKNAYAGVNPGEYWAEICQSYFDCNRVNNWNHGPIGTREQLKAYDPEGYELVRTTFNLSPEQDWRYAWLQTAAERRAAAGEVQDRSVLHEVHLGARVHRARSRGERRGAAEGQRHDPQDVRLPPRHPEGADRRRREARRAGPRRETRRPAGVQGTEATAGLRPALARCSTTRRRRNSWSSARKTCWAIRATRTSATNQVIRVLRHARSIT